MVDRGQEWEVVDREPEWDERSTHHVPDRAGLWARLRSRPIASLIAIFAVGALGGIGISQVQDDASCVDAIQRFNALERESRGDPRDFDRDFEAFAEALRVVRRQPDCFPERLQEQVDLLQRLEEGTS